ncbi:MAG: flippase-like domain-containing protein [Pseudonocardia sp.]|nr:flippase-like domain-containing protein [Pseudonocardia sp.]
MTHGTVTGGRVPARPTLRGPWLRLLVGVAILAALVAMLGREAFAAGLRVVDLRSVLAALGIGLVTTVFGALRWRLVARRVGLELGVADAVAENYRATFLNAVLPSGVLGDVDRAVRHGRDAGDVGRSARAVLLERTAGQVVLVAVAVAVLPTQPGLVSRLVGGIQAAPIVAIMVGVALLAGAVTAVVTVVVRTRRGTGLLARWLTAMDTDVRAGVLSRDTWPALVGLSAATLAGYLTLFVIAARAAGTTASLTDLLPLLVLALMAMGLPINVGGWGPREGVAALGFWMAGLGAPLGVTVSVAYGVLALIASLPGGVVLLLRRRAARPGPAGIDAISLPTQRAARRPGAHSASPSRPVTTVTPPGGTARTGAHHAARARR